MTKKAAVLDKQSKEIGLTPDEAYSIISYYRGSYLAYSPNDLKVIKKLSFFCKNNGIKI